MKSKLSLALSSVALTASLPFATAHAVESVKANDLGVAEAPTAGSTPVDLADVPPLVLHAARVAFKEYDGRAVLTGAQVDADEIVAIYEVKGHASDGTLLEADIQADAVLVELEIEISRHKVPGNVREAVRRFAPGFEASEESAIEKSIRPSAGGLPEIWYEFSGVTFDVEVRSDARAVLIEPA
ncbi:MAG: hypothetical protein M3436_16755 [Pseudomonadota bacterium]|nr:hypothetical protein [Pseudomonadota bacterium]